MYTVSEEGSKQLGAHKGAVLRHLHFHCVHCREIVVDVEEISNEA
jgi:hypothetical protein